MDDKAQDLIRRIERAFSGSKLHDGYTLRKCAALDSRVEESDPDLASIPCCQRWQEIPDQDMHLFGTHGILVHSGEINAQFYLPPAMIYVLKNYKGDVLDEVSEVASALEFSIGRNPPLDEEQREITKDFIDWLESLQEDYEPN